MSFRSEARDYYAILGAEPSASAAELRGAFREAVLRHHPDRTAASEIATRRTSMLNRAWAELRDPVRRLHYDRDLERGRAALVEWPLEDGEVSRRRQRGRVEPLPRSRWHQPEWRTARGFRVPAEVFVRGPAAQDRWIVEHHIAVDDWRAHSERYWLRYAAEHYRERGRVDDWLGSLERLLDVDQSYDTLVQSGLREAYLATTSFLRGAARFERIAVRYPAGTPQRAWVDREVRALLGAFRDARVRRGAAAARAENGEMLMNYLEVLGMTPTFADLRAAIVAHRRAGNLARASELVSRAANEAVTDPARWFSLVQLLTESGQLERASALLAEVARGEHPEALDRKAIGGDPGRRIAAARRRLRVARGRAATAHAG